MQTQVETLHAGERGSKTSVTATPSGKVRLVVHPVSGSQEGGQFEAGDKPTPTEPVCVQSALQDGRHSSLEGPASNRGLGHSNRSQEYIYGANPPSRSEIPLVHMEVSDLPVQILSVWAIGSASRVVMKPMRPVVGYLRRKGVKGVVYTDHMLMMSHSPQCLQEHTVATLNLLEALRARGFRQICFQSGESCATRGDTAIARSLTHLSSNSCGLSLTLDWQYRVRVAPRTRGHT